VAQGSGVGQQGHAIATILLQL